MYTAILLPRAEKSLRKIKEQGLLERFRDCVEAIQEQPFKSGKVGDLAGVWAHGFSYRGVAYRVAYLVDEEEKKVYIIGLGSHEGFWNEIKRYLK
ncbi:MAG TPA: type II toxin-antitoxin system RelE/ParE family toxin [Firmicutes bacterium]|nr:type II toxin-antitoxin system RelE/ParE family toxin [Bacillota bacterium]